MILLALVETVCMRLRNEHHRAGVVSISLKTNEFISYSRQKVELPHRFHQFIYETAISLFDETWKENHCVIWVTLI